MQLQKQPIVLQRGSVSSFLMWMLHTLGRKPCRGTGNYHLMELECPNEGTILEH